MPAPLSAQTIATVKATVPALEAHGLAVVQAMYAHLFRNDEIRDLFNQSHQGPDGSQPRALAGAILAYAANIDDLGVLLPTVERIAQKHAGLNILPEHYPHVATALVEAIRDVLGDAATEEVIAAWAEAYWFLAEILIGREGQIYAEQARGPGGWTGWRRFVVERVETESETIKSFYLRPLDGRTVVRHKAGQFLTFRLDLPGRGPVKRNYSISSAPDDVSYRITIKREAAPADRPDAPAGAASNWFHDEVAPGAVLEAAPPAGDFVLDAADGPVVLVSGGVGLTPLVSMLEAIASDGAQILTWFVHGTQNSRVHAMSERVRELAAAHPGIQLAAFYEAPDAGDIRGEHYDEQGYITIEWLKANTPFEQAVFYLCGPRPFLRALVNGLVAEGVEPRRIRYEFFGPADEQLAA